MDSVLDQYIEKCEKQPTNIVELIHRQMQKNNNKKKEGRNVCKYYPSSAGKCSRAIVYQMLGYEQKEMEGRILSILENGNYMHSRIEDILEQTGLMVAPELSFEKPEWRISGRSDAVIRNFLPHESSNNIIKLTEPVYKLDENKDPVRDEQGNKIKLEDKLIYEGADNDVMIVELKSVSDKGFNYTPKEEHQLQLQLYMYLTGIKLGILLYENKNTQELKEFHFEYDEKKAQRVVNQIIYVNDHVDRKELPIREYEKTDFNCRYCNFKHYCWPTKNTYSLTDILNIRKESK